MCGIFGAFGRVPSGALDAAAQALHHRGPDAAGRYVDDRVSLLHARLKIIDLSDAAAQPMANEDGTIVVIFNGEIYNHRNLRTELEPHHQFRSRSDTESILRGYETWGDEVIERLDGMFALAIWDARRGRFLLARDRPGKKPLFFTDPASGEFRFASTIGAIRASGFGSQPRVAALPMYLAYGFVPQPETFFEGVRQLGPGERMSIALNTNGKPGTAIVERYFKPSFGTAPCADPYPTARTRVRSLVEAAVDRRLESDVPLGAFLSGGIDSSIIVGIMAQRLDKVRTFSIGFSGDARFDETAFARIAATAFRTDHTEFILDPTSFELVESLVRHHDGPFGDSSAIPTSVVARLTREHVTVALTGDGGDEVFCGYHRFLAAEVAEWIPAGARRLAARAVHLLPAGEERSLLGKGRRFLDAAALPLADRIARWNSFFPDPATMLRADVVAALGDEISAPLSWQRRLIADACGAHPLHRILEHNYRSYLPEDLLVKADRCSMAHALEARSPFLDTALLEYVQQLPPAYLRRGSQTKRILKDAFSDLLPSQILHRGKMGFGVPLGTWFRGDLRGYLHDHLAAGARIDAYLDRRAVDRLLAEHASSTADHGQRLWALLTLEIWLRSLA